MKKLFESFYISREGAVDQFTGDIQRIRDEMVKSRGMSDELRKSLEDIALANPALSSTALQLITFGDRLNAIGKAVGDWTDNLKKRSEEHTSELQSLMRISYAVFCLKKKTPVNRYKTK